MDGGAVWCVQHQNNILQKNINAFQRTLIMMIIRYIKILFFYVLNLSMNYLDKA